MYFNETNIYFIITIYDFAKNIKKILQQNLQKNQFYF